jgi:hypothetical protein
MINPALSGMDYFNKEDLEKVIPPPTAPSDPVEPIPEKVAEEPVKKKRVLKVKKETSAPPSEPVEPIAEKVAEEPVKKKRVLKLKRDPPPSS